MAYLQIILGILMAISSIAIFPAPVLWTLLGFLGWGIGTSLVVAGMEDL